MTIWGSTDPEKNRHLTRIHSPNKKHLRETHGDIQLNIASRAGHRPSTINNGMAIHGSIHGAETHDNIHGETGPRNPEDLARMNGEFAFAWIKKNKLHLGRDRIGSIPLYYAVEDSTAFSTNKKALWDAGYKEVKRVRPGTITKINGEPETREIVNTSQLKQTQKTDNDKEIGQQLIDALDRAIRRNLEGQQEVGIAFSGGIDSSIIARISSRYTDVHLYTVGLENSPDIKWSKKAAEHLDLPHKTIEITIKDIKREIPETIKATCSATRLSVGVGLPFLVLGRELHQDGLKVVITGQGSDELFGGYDRYKNTGKPEEEIMRDIENIAEKDLERDYSVFMHNNVEPRNPFLSYEVVRKALSIPVEQKIPTDSGLEKQVLRVGAKQILPSEITSKPKKSLQYGSRVDREIDRIARREGYKRREKHHVDRYLHSVAQNEFNEPILQYVTRSFDN
ncbi:asparagine synthase-related protein [Methanonatronarchaeum sp. AMET6-2]|uniref:DUF7411 family protein n=1 Tax=Methanonatronarchaeum sp. AMET6-2 TaxID=2933293 RepID=UPI001FF30F05|nr:asparagine synthetase B [Methanonatronarchaeum sp. AMET6-2]UOY10427.1 asparagine synthetase B [Methanonatronarchaeum sp. AMET6-2]